jgi:uncharacterized damage-inducible protein DinB
MNTADFRKLYAYTEWANERILDVIAGLSEEQFHRTIVSSFSSIRDTLHHIVFAEWLWLQRWKEHSPRQLPEWSGEASFERLREHLRAVAADRRAFLEALTDERIESALDYTNLKGDPFTMPLGEVLLHCANHSTYHRGQLVTMLRQAGVTAVPSTDYTQFLRS